ncbi:MAG: hypothetical protein EA428_09065, partial [Spirochaetaceae bacterium]
MLRHRSLILLFLLSHLAPVLLWASPPELSRGTRIQPESIQIDLPDPRMHAPELRNELEPLLHQAAHEANVLFGDHIEVWVGPAAEAPQIEPQYSLRVLAQRSATGNSMVLQLTRTHDSQSSVNFPLLGAWDTHLPRLTAHAIRYLHYSFREPLSDPNIDPKSEKPLFLDEFSSSMISMIDLGHTSRVFPMSIDIGPGGHIFLGALFVAVELDHLYREVAKPGSDIYTRDSTNYGVDVRVSAAGTVFARGMGEDFFVIHPDHPRHQRLRMGIANPVASTVLSDGSYVATTGQRTVRIHDSSMHSLDLRAHESAFTMILAAGPDASLWTWDPVLGAALVYSAEGERLDSIVPLMPEADRRTVRALRVLPDGSFVLLSTEALYRFDKLGSPIWRMASLPAPLHGDFSMVGSIAVDAERGYIYGLNASAQRMFRLIDRGLTAELSELDAQVLKLNAQRAADPGSRTVLADLARLYEDAGAPGLALEMRRSALERDPFDAELNDAFNRSEGLLLADRAVQGAERALEIRRSIGPESAAPMYTVAVQQFEQSLSRLRGFSAEHAQVARKLSSFQREFSALEAPPPRPPRVEVAGLSDIFPALIQSYRSTPAGHLQVTNTLDEELSELRVTTSFRFADFAAQTEPVPTLSPGASVEVPVYVTLAPEVLNLQEDIPVMFKIELSYLHAGAEQQVSLNRTVMMRRNTALLWDDSGKLASFITPNDEIVQNFALSVLSGADGSGSGVIDIGDSTTSGTRAFGGLMSEKVRQAALIADAVGVYGIRYVEDPASPFTEVFGRSDVLDTVRFPRTTLRVRSGDCDDTASLLASLYEAVGIRTAIMTSPGHVFIAFDTEEPAANEWIYANERRSVIRHGGTLWIPVETTILERGFPAAWEEASRLVRAHGGAYGAVHGGEIEFLPLAELRALYPAIPLGPAGFSVVAPATAAVQLRADRSREQLVAGIYQWQVERLEAEAAALATEDPARLSALNRLGILHARAGSTTLARGVFQEILAAAPTSVPALINLANIDLLQGDYLAARTRAREILRARPFSVAALTISIRAALQLEELVEAQRLLEEMRTVDSEAAAQISGTHPALLA